jgi:hypothetical protein
MKRLFNGMGDSDDEQNERDETGKIPTPDGVSNMPKKKVRNENKFIKGIKNILQLIVIILLIPLIFLWELLTNIFTFGIWIEHKSVLTWNMPRPISDFYRKHGNFLDAIFGIFDRVGVVLIAVIATMPYFLNFTKVIGMSGLIAMVVIFALRGNFSALIKDIVEKEEDEKKREAKKKVENSRSSPLFVEVVNSNESPIEIKNSKYNPLIIDSDYYNPIPVNIVKGIENSSSNPLSVQVVNGVQVFSYDSIPVEVTNIVTTQQDD